MKGNDRNQKPEYAAFFSRKFKVRKGIVLETVCDENILVAAGEARHFCPYIQPLNESAAYLWRLLEKGMTLDQIVDRATIDYELPVEEILPGLQDFMETLFQKGYLYKLL